MASWKKSQAIFEAGWSSEAWADEGGGEERGEKGVKMQLCLAPAEEEEGGGRESGLQ